MNIALHQSTINQKSNITITGSKSESNRLLLLQALCPTIQIRNLSNSDDTQLMHKALHSKSNVIDVHHAGTAMRFLTAYFAIQKDKTVAITGSARMKQRPIQILVEALNSLGGNINYIENKGCPPLQIGGQEITKHKVSLSANISSQYISALLLIAPKLKNGLELTLEGKITSLPYINMTLNLLKEIGVQATFHNNIIKVNPLLDQPKSKTLVVESDWSSASYYYSIVALSKIDTEIKLSAYKKDSLQADSVLVEIYKYFGVETTFNDNSITLKKSKNVNHESPFNLDLSNAPDIAQTIAVTCLGLGIACNLTGLHTLKIKETDRLLALQAEMEKLGGQVTVTDDSLQLLPSKTIESNIEIETYNDHRMAMAFAPLALKIPIIIKDADVVSKSYPGFWDDLQTIGVRVLSKQK